MSPVRSKFQAAASVQEASPAASVPQPATAAVEEQWPSLGQGMAPSVAHFFQREGGGAAPTRAPTHASAVNPAAARVSAGAKTNPNGKSGKATKLCRFGSKCRYPPGVCLFAHRDEAEESLTVTLTTDTTVDSVVSSKGTLDVSILSVLHSRSRKVERAVTKEETQRCKKRGTYEWQPRRGASSKNKAHEGRWKVSHGDVVVILSADKQVLVTTYRLGQPLPLSPGGSEEGSTTEESVTITRSEDRSTTLGGAPKSVLSIVEESSKPAPAVPFSMARQCAPSSRDLWCRSRERVPPDVDCTSHTVLVVDLSGSMRANDPGGSTRKDAVFESLARHFAQPQISPDSQKNGVSLIVFKDGIAELIFDRRPLNMDLMLDLLECKKHLSARGDGNYRPALKLVENATLADGDGEYAVVVMFLSDGGPSDPAIKDIDLGRWGIPSYEIERYGSSYEKQLYLQKHVMSHEMRALRRSIGPSRFRAIAVGIGDAADFGVLETMAKSVKGTYLHRNLIAGKGITLNDIFRTLSDTLSETRTSITGASLAHGSRVERSDIKIEKTKSSDVASEFDRIMGTSASSRPQAKSKAPAFGGLAEIGEDEEEDEDEDEKIFMAAVDNDSQSDSSSSSEEEDDEKPATTVEATTDIERENDAATFVPLPVSVGKAEYRPRASDFSGMSVDTKPHENNRIPRPTYSELAAALQEANLPPHKINTGFVPILVSAGIVDKLTLLRATDESLNEAGIKKGNRVKVLNWQTFHSMEQRDISFSSSAEVSAHKEGVVGNTSLTRVYTRITEHRFVFGAEGDDAVVSDDDNSDDEVNSDDDRGALGTLVMGCAVVAQTRNGPKKGTVSGSSRQDPFTGEPQVEVVKSDGSKMWIPTAGVARDPGEATGPSKAERGEKSSKKQKKEENDRKAKEAKKAKAAARAAAQAADAATWGTEAAEDEESDAGVFRKAGAAVASVAGAAGAAMANPRKAGAAVASAASAAITGAAGAAITGAAGAAGKAAGAAGKAGKAASRAVDAVVDEMQERRAAAAAAELLKDYSNEKLPKKKKK